MEFIFFLGGVIVGVSCTMIFKKDKNDVKGIIDIDHDNNFCRIRMISKDVVDNKKIEAKFALNHDFDVSREEQIL